MRAAGDPGCRARPIHRDLPAVVVDGKRGARTHVEAALLGNLAVG